jgi:hypothetical protein
MHERESAGRTAGSRPAAEAEEVRARLGAGEPVEPRARRRMELAFGGALDDVRVHTGAEAGGMAGERSASAFTVGRDVVFAPGTYAPGTFAGNALLAHELAHVVQQRSGRAGTEAAGEREANAAARGALLGGGMRPSPGMGLRLQRCPTEEREAAEQAAGGPEALQKIGDPKDSPTFEHWLGTFPSHSKAGETRDIAASAPGISAEVAAGKLDCADVALLLRHHWLKAHERSLSFKVGPKGKETTLTIGKGADEAALKTCTDNAGSPHFQELRPAYKLVNFYGSTWKPTRNLKSLVAAGLKPGDVMVWTKQAGEGGNYSGHVQTVQAVDAAAGKITIVQGTMTGDTGAGELQQRTYSFSDLTGKADGDAEVQNTGSLTFTGAGPWKE